MDMRNVFIDLFTSATQDTPKRPSVQVVGGQWVLTIKGNSEKWAEMVQAAGVPSHAEQSADGDTLTVRWPSVADTIFAPGGLMDSHLDGYEMRRPQLHMARLVQRAIEMQEPAIIEAGTGTGKSFAYAAVAMAMNKRVIISTSNKALQAQLYKKDIPFLCELFPGKKVALAQGKSNYLCHDRIHDTPITDGALQEWFKSTETGNVEDLEFQAKDVAKWTANEECTGRRCDFYDLCFYYKARAALQGADVVICNHALLVLNQQYPNILPPADVVVVDEAHKLADYARNALAQDFTPDSVRRVLNMAFENDAQTATAETLLQKYSAELHVASSQKEREIGVASDKEFPSGLRLANALTDIADEIWEETDTPQDKSEQKRQKRADRVRNLADKVKFACSKTQTGFTRWIEAESNKLISAPYDVSNFIGRMAGFERTKKKVLVTLCAKCGRRLTANSVHVLDGLPYGPDCIRHVDLFGGAEAVELTEWLGKGEEIEVEHEPAAIIFTSATIAAPNLAHFMRECGLSHGFQMVAESPFDYASNALLYIPNGETPLPNAPTYPNYMVNDIRSLVMSAGGGAFLLFTSYQNMQYAVTELRTTFERNGLSVFVQGELPKAEIAKRFREDGNAVLFATKSFWEGVSIEGQALRLVVIDKMPFQAPSPMLKARETTVKNPFIDLNVPEMVIELKQGSGRLIRNMSDYGVIAILDPRIRLKPYGRSLVIPALPSARLVASTAAVGEFFRDRKSFTVEVDFPVDFSAIEELAF